jgi:hypothetical protein
MQRIDDYGKIRYKHVENFKQIYSLGHVKHEYLDTFTDLLCEDVLARDTQVTIDGFVCGGKFGWFGLTHSVFLPNRISFKRFDFPFKLKETVYNEIVAGPERILEASGLNNTLFDIELAIDMETGSAKLIEINTRPSAQFMYPIHWVTKVDPLNVALEIATGGRNLQLEDRESGRACSVCVLRRDSDARLISLPQKSAVEKLKREYTGLRVNYFAWPGDKLSDYPQDSRTFRYAEIVVPHDASENINEMLPAISEELEFVFADG